MKRILLAGLLLLTLATAALLGWLVHSESGLRWIYRQAAPMLPGELQVQELAGSLDDSIVLRGVQFTDSSLSLGAERVTLQWNFWALLVAKIDVSSLAIEGLAIESHAGPADAGQSPSSPTPPQLALPLDLVLQELTIDQLRLNLGQDLYQLEQIRLSAAMNAGQLNIDALTLRVVDLAIDANHVYDIDISLAGEIDVRGNYPQQLTVDWQTRLPTGAIISNSARIDGDLESLRLAQQTSGPLQAQLSLQLQNPLERLSWQASLDVASFDTALLDSALPELRGALQLSARGDLNSARASGRIDADSSDIGKFDARFELRNLDPPRLADGLRFDSLDIGIYDGSLAAQGELYWSPGLSWKGQLSANAINPAGLLPDWPGKLNAELHSEGRYDDDGLVASARITGASGRLRDYPFSLQGNLHWREDLLHIESLDLAMFDGKLAAQGQVSLAPALSWNGRLRASGINPAVLFAEWPGKLSADLHSEGRYDNGELIASARIDEASGSLRDYPFTLKSDLQWRADNLEIESALLTSGDTQISANGRVGERVDLQWSLDSQDLAELYPAAQGQLRASGHLGGELTAPIVKARFNGRSLVIDEYRVASIDGDVNVDLLNWQQLDIRVAASNLDLQGQHLQSLSVNGNQHKLNASLLGADVSARIELTGALVEQGWRGTLTAAEIESVEFADWSLQAPAAVSLSGESLSIERICLLSTRQAQSCGSVRRSAETWNIELELAGIPLQLLRQWTPPQLQLDGTVNVSADLEYRAGGKLLGKLDASLPAASASYPLQDDRVERFAYRLAELNLLLGPQRLTADTRLVLENGDRLQGSVVMPEADLLRFDGERQPIQASFTVNARDWAVLDAMLPQIRNPRGVLELDVDATGTLGQPRLQGSAKLSDGSIELPDLDLKIERIGLRAQSDGSQRMRFDIEAVAAGGTIAVRGDTLLDRDSGWPSNLSLNADNLEIATLLSRWIEQPLLVNGKLKASAELKFSTPDQLTGIAHFSSASGRLAYPLLDQELDRWNYRNASLSVNLEERGISARSSVDIGKKNAISAEIDLPGARLLALDPEQQALSGSADFDIRELDLVQHLVPEIDKIKGQLALVLTVGGRLAHPWLKANADMQQASFNIPRLGLQIRQISLQGSSDDQNHFNFKLFALSGDGSLTIEGSSLLDPQRGWPSTIFIKGNDFEVSRIPEAQVSVTPDLTISNEARNILVEGNVLLPFARLQPKDISTAARVSNDTVIIGREQPVEERWQVTTRVNLSLGERVSFFGFGFEGKLGGRLLVEDTPGQLSIGTGEITIREGRYRAYGQRLDIDNGRLLFTGSALDNPGLDVRAVRQVNEITVGLQVTGRLQQPELELFSVPSMGQTDQLSYLLLGRPMETASGSEGAMMAKAALALGLAGGDSLARRIGDRFGLDEVRVESSDDGDQASLVVGRYLSPKLYVSYGVGLIESINSLNLRYELTERWKLEAESGEYQGADLLFSIER